MLKKYLKRYTPQIIKDSYHNAIIIRDNFYIAYNQLFKQPKRAKCSKQKVIVFLVQRTEVWNSVKTVYETARKKKNVITYVVAIPPYKGGKLLLDDLSTYEFCKSFCDNAINAYDAERKIFFEISKLAPSYIFLNVPYTDEYPEQYRIDHLAKICSICYIPYGYTLIEGGLQSVNLRRDLLSNVRYIFSESDITEKYCRKNLFLTNLLGKKVVYNLGFPRFDLYKDVSFQDNKKITIMWIPRWTTKSETDNGNEPSSFFEYKDSIIDWISQKDEISLIIRPHPRAFPNYITSGEMLKSEVDEYIHKIMESANIIFDQDSSYYSNLLKADVLLADFSSIVAEYFVTGKPIIYYGDGRNFTSQGKQMYNTFYHVKSWKEAMDTLSSILEGDDKKFEDRRKVINEFLRGNNFDSGNRIVTFLLNQ